MTISYSLAVKNARLAQVLAALDGGPGVAQLVIGTSALSGVTGVIATLPLLKPSFSISGGVMTLLGVPLTATASITGVAVKAELRDSTDAVVASGLSVGPSGDIEVSDPNFLVGQLVQVISGTITHA